MTTTVDRRSLRHLPAARALLLMEPYDGKEPGMSKNVVEQPAVDLVSESSVPPDLADLLVPPRAV